MAFTDLQAGLAQKARRVELESDLEARCFVEVTLEFSEREHIAREGVRWWSGTKSGAPFTVTHVH